MRKLLYISAILLAGVFGSCSEEDILEKTLSPEQESLIGRAINFNTSYIDAFVSRASTYTDKIDGSFNQRDRMRIYRNYYENGAWSTDEAFRTYSYIYKTDATTGIDLGKDWRPESGRTKADHRNPDGTYDTQTQSATDSLVWENGKTLRFRAWSQSNYHDILYGATKSYFYPDFSLADYVNASGPSTSIPLVLKHMGSRMIFSAKESGNEIQRVEVCAGIDINGNTVSDAWKDYMYKDNADSNLNDQFETEASKTEEKAKQECADVTAVFRQMCMPAGVDLDRFTLKAIKSTEWNNLSNAQVRTLEDLSEDKFIKYNTLSEDDIASQARHAFFCNINGLQIMVTIPYNISSNVSTQGEILTLPACTRFRIYMRDINNGDKENTSGYEGKYHIFALSDVKDGNGNPAFPDGLKFGAGVSYRFYVGYRYGALSVVVSNDLSWDNQVLDHDQLKDPNDVPPVSTFTDYQWWKEAITTAVTNAPTNGYRPVFHISNEKEFLEFINLVNGTTGAKTDGLYLLDRTVKDENGKDKVIKWWSKRNSIYSPTWVTEEEMEAEGYIFYDHYHAANADKAAYSERDYLKGPYSFYDGNLTRNFEVKLDADLDLKDWSLESIGKLVTTPFRGNFDGQGHTIKNLNLKDECLFGYMDGNGNEHASITNLKIESVHNTCLLNTGENQIYIAGISIHAPSSTNSIARIMHNNVADGNASLVVGCIHIGDAGGALVGSALNMNMFGCMQAARGLSSESGALIGVDANNPKVFTPQISLVGQKLGTNVKAKPSFRNFIANYYDKELSKDAKAVGSTSDNYSLLEYIRGSKTFILCAKNDFLTTDVPMETLLKQSNYTNYYGLAPWRAMNYAIYWYNKNRVTSQINHPCTMHFENDLTGYVHRYPVLMNQKPEEKYTVTEVEGWNPVSQTN